MTELPPPRRSRFRVNHTRIAAARKGSLEERHDLLEACRRYLHKVANRMLDSDLRPRVGASDLVQESIIAAERDFAQFDGEDERALFAWLTKILENRLAENIRRHRSSQKRNLNRDVSLAENPTLEEQFLRSSSTPSAHAIAIEEENLLQEALQRVSPDQRQLIFWRNWELLSFVEIGNRLGISSGAATKRWVRAIKKLKKELGNRP